MVNFEFMRPWYKHQVDLLSKNNQLDMVEQAYRCMGGNDFKDLNKAAQDKAQAQVVSTTVPLKQKASDM